MSGTSLYRRHRPASFADVVGQEHVVRTLSNAIERGKVHHAYLFVGSRGTGKTSMAKILARSLNCVNGPTLTPCGECDSCISIAAGNSMDVYEMDAASNRSVEDIRELRDRVGYAPAQGSWKVYILDEAHMLTTEAWNAFLKTLEEPPPNTVFVLATTEAHKVKPTIVDRCQRFDFRRPTPEQVAEVVERVAKLESIELADQAVAAIARSARGSFRDALGTLDQLTSFCGNQIALEDVLAVLGVADSELLFSTADAIASGDGAALLQIATDALAAGNDPSQLASELAEHLRRLLVARTIGEVPESLLATPEEAERLAKQAGTMTDAGLVRAIDFLWGAVIQIREGDDPRLALELALLKSSKPELDPGRRAITDRLERLERALGEGGEPVEIKRATPAPESKTEEFAAKAVEAVEAVGEALDLGRVEQAWDSVIEQVRGSSEMLSTALAGARPVEVDSERSLVKVGFPSDQGFNKRTADTPGAREDFAEAVRSILGRAIKPIFVLLEDESSPVVEPEPMSEDEVIARLKEEFDAEEMVDEADPPAQRKATG